MQRHTTRWLALFLCTSALACGDDSAAGGSSSGGNSNGGSNEGGDTSVGAGNQGGDTSVGAGNQGGNETGGAASGGNGTGGAATGGSGQGGGVNAGADGASCVDDTDCDGGICLSEDLTGFPGGMCSEDCTSAGSCTAAGSSCVDLFDTGDLFCLRDCDPATAGSCGSPATLSCFDVNGAPQGGLCVAICDMNNDCTVAGNECQFEPEGYCAPPEVCDNDTDDDFDGDTDCGDADCAALPECAAGTCATPTALTDGVIASGTTVGATNTADSICATASGNEVVFSYTSATTGGLFVSMLSASDQGIHVRTTCTDAGTELACADAVLGNQVETVGMPITAGQTVFIFVDAYQPGEEDSFQVVAEAFTEVCDDFFDGDADGDPDCADFPECNGTAACTPGATPQNGACTANNNCASTVGNDPACLTVGFLGANERFCSEWCDPVADDCGALRSCIGLQGLNEGVCLTDCTTNAQCPAGFLCTDIGAATDFCMPDAPAAWTCNPDYYADGFCDCGCAVFDPDCPDATAASCEYCDGGCSAIDCSDIDPLDNSTCN
ncbi:MAG: hypothetical protein JNK04_24265 [Myxococcales bacterium]|nr:hypothetical protein [Myxococcales bacterium]